MKMASHLFRAFFCLFGVALTLLLPSPTLAATKVSAGQLQGVQYTFCGDQVSVQSSGWTSVTNRSASPAGPVQGYTGPSRYTVDTTTGPWPSANVNGGIGNSNSGNCSGLYYWAWNQPSLTTTWTLQNVALYKPECSVWIYIPSWYAGAPDAQYSLILLSNDAGQTFNFAPLNQQPYSAQWVPLVYQGNTRFYFPDPNANTYTFDLVLHGGNTSGRYLAASAVRFSCISTQTQGTSGVGRGAGK